VYRVKGRHISKVVHAPYGGLHLEQEGGVASFGARDLAAGISEDEVFPSGVNLREDGPHTSGFFFFAEAGIGDEAEMAVSAGVPYHWGRT